MKKIWELSILLILGEREFILPRWKNLTFSYKILENREVCSNLIFLDTPRLEWIIEQVITFISSHIRRNLFLMMFVISLIFSFFLFTNAGMVILL